MNHQRTFATNGVGRRTRPETTHRSDAPNWRSAAAPSIRQGYQNHASSNSSSPPSTGRHSGIDEDELGAGTGSVAHDNPVHGRLLFLTMCLVGQFVDVHLKDGSVYSGIFHTANVGKDFGVVLKMARLKKEAPGKKGDPVKQAPKRPPIKMYIIYAKDLVQIVAKDVFLTGQALPNGRSRENKNDLLTDSFISHGRRDTERELMPWKPDSEAPKDLGLENTFQNSFNRNWDQFETNKALFGVETTFDEELYTTKLERGPQTREREREALRLAREIEVESYRSSQFAEDRGGSDVELDNLDEESRYSSVLRQRGDDGDEDDHHKDADNYNDETFGASSESNGSTPTAGILTTQDPMAPSVVSHSQPTEDVGLHTSTSGSLQDDLSRDSREPKNQDISKRGKKEEFKSPGEAKEKSLQKTTSNAIAVSKLAEEQKAPGESLEAPPKATTPPLPSGPPASAVPIPVALNNPTSGSSSSGSSRSPKKSEAPIATDGGELAPATSSAQAPASPSASISSAGSSTVKKSTLNPNSKEFKLNPNAKVFTPSFSTPRPASPVNQGAVFLPAGLPVAPIQPMPVGLGYVHQPGQPAQFTQYNNTMAVSGVTASPSYAQPAATFVPTVPPIKLPQTQPQVTATPYGQQTIRYVPPVQTAAYPPPNYPQQVIYGQPPFFYIPQYPQGVMHGQPIQVPQQTPLPPPVSSQLTQPQKHLGAEMVGVPSPAVQSPVARSGSATGTGGVANSKPIRTSSSGGGKN